jgi:CMP-N-acetylneuraminic acid synthetase
VTSAEQDSQRLDVICVIPARGGSKGLPRKNVRELAGHPLIAYPIAGARASGVCDAIFVTTDDEEIASQARRYGADVPFLRPEALAEDLTTTEATLQHAICAYEDHIGHRASIAVFLTPTDIFRQPSWIAEAVGMLRERPELESVFAAHTVHKNFWQRGEDGGLERILPWMRDYSSRQIRQKIWREDTGLTCASRAQLWRAERRIGDRVEIIENDRSETSIDIHEEIDLVLAEAALGWLRENAPERAPVDPGAFL